MKNKDALDAIKQLEYTAALGRKLIEGKPLDAEVEIVNEKDRSTIGFLNFIWSCRPPE